MRSGRHTRRGSYRPRNNYKRRRYNSRPRRSAPQRSTIYREMYISNQTDPKQEKETYKGDNFSSLNLDPRLKRNLSKLNFNETTEIQTKAIPLILQRKNVLGISETGSGKTAAFLIPMLQKLLLDRTQKLLIVAPTRELAQQTAKEAIRLVNGLGMNVSIVIGGESMGKQISQLRRGDNIVVGTPGRLLDLSKRKILNLSKYNNIVIDEVDRMMDMGFIADIRTIFSMSADTKQALFFSATHNDSVEKITKGLVGSFEIVKLANNTANTSVVQDVIDYSSSSEKIRLLEDLLQRGDVFKAIIFVETKRYADTITKTLSEKKFRVQSIHGDKRQNVRKRTIDQFRQTKINYLVATNVAARGIDIDDITHVINLDEPKTYDEYIHRIGRTGRNGNAGVAYTFVRKG